MVEGAGAKIVGPVGELAEKLPGRERFEHPKRRRRMQPDQGRKLGIARRTPQIRDGDQDVETADNAPDQIL